MAADEENPRQARSNLKRLENHLIPDEGKPDALGCFAQFGQQIFGDPGPAGALEVIRRSPMLPDGVADGLERVSLEGRLGEQAGEVAAQDITAAALSEVRVARGIYVNRSGASAYERLMALQDHPGIAKFLREIADRLDTIGLNLLRVGAKQPGRLSRVRRDDPERFDGRGGWIIAISAIIRKSRA